MWLTYGQTVYVNGMIVRWLMRLTYGRTRPVPKMRLNCVKNFGAHLVGATKMHEDKMCRSTGNATKERTSYTWNVPMNSNLNFTHPHPGVVLWIRIGGVKRMHRTAPADHLTGLCWPS